MTRDSNAFSQVDHHRDRNIVDEMIADAIAEERWVAMLSLLSSEERVPWLMDLWEHICDDERAEVLAYAIASGDLLRHERDRLQACLIELRDEDNLVFDGDCARAIYADLPDPVTLYRGTVAAEIGAFGVSWTVDRDIALWFACEHGRFRNTNSPAIILTSVVPKAAISGVLASRREQEVLVVSEALGRVTLEIARSGVGQ